MDPFVTLAFGPGEDVPPVWERLCPATKPWTASDSRFVGSGRRARAGGRAHSRAVQLALMSPPKTEEIRHSLRVFALIEVVLAAFEAVTGTRTRAGCLLYFLGTVVLLAALYLVFG